MDTPFLCHRPGMDRAALSPLARSFERHLRAETRAANPVDSSLDSVRQAETYLADHGRTLLDARRGDLEAFLAELLARRAPGTVATRHKVLRILYRWLEEEGEIPTDPMARMKPPIVPSSPSRSWPRTACGGCWRSVPARPSRPAATPPSSCSCSTPAPAAPSSPACAWPTWTPTSTSRWCSARAAASGPCPLAARPPWRSTATCASAPATRTPRRHGCGSGSA